MTTERSSERDVVGFPVVGIGASAGGLAAFEAFFAGMPPDEEPDMAFVLVQHLAPDHKSILTELIKRQTRLQVFEVADGMRVEPNCTYVIPPNRNMAIIDGVLRLSELSFPRSQNLPIDFFFRSLATELHERAICVILSGTGSDGTLGLRAVKGEGGIAIAQTPDTAEYDGMPTSAISSGLVDYQLPPGEMVQRIVSFVHHSNLIAQKPEALAFANDEDALRRIFHLIRCQTEHDFSQYKPNTINRRIERRLAIHQVKSIAEYVKLLQETPSEIDALFQDLLIGVTSFFRDKDAFKILEEEIIPKLFEGKPAGSSIRVWCPGCSTGEEPYSIAMLLQEYLEKINEKYVIQVFGTDIDRQSIATARKGIYPDSITADLTPQRISRFFTPVPEINSYSVTKSLRDILIFSEQSIIKDPPFSRIDLIACRNFLIYVSSELQKKLIPLFHYSLSPDGILFLGNSETVGEFEYLFRVLDRKHKFYQRKEDLQGIQRAKLTQVLPQIVKPGLRSEGKKPEPPESKQSLREITEQAILRESSVAGVLVNERGDILYLHGRTGVYFEPSQGEAGINNILQMARDGLKRQLTVALRSSTVKKETVRLTEINVKTNSHFTKVNLSVKPVATAPVPTNDQALYIVLFEEVKVKAVADKLETKTPTPAGESSAQLETLKEELRIKEDYLQTANEELEASNEQLRSSNEVMQSLNDELQSTNEELETSKEELQSINEELATVNSELQIKVYDLTKANNDVKNLLAGTNIATVFLDRQQKILSFTPTANNIINLLLTDVGRPVAHIVSKFVDYDGLNGDVKDVLDTLIPKETQVQTTDGKWYNMIIQPYRTIENVIEGAVLTFVDITEAKHAKDMLAVAEMSYWALLETAREGIMTLDGKSGRIKNVNPYLINLLGYPEKLFLGKEIWDIGPLQAIVPNKRKFAELKKQQHISYASLPLETADGEEIEVEFTSNVFEIDQYQIVQCNIREIVRRNEPDQAELETDRS